MSLVEPRLTYSWSDLMIDTGILANAVTAARDWSPENIVAVARGGLFVAGALSQHLNIRHIYTVCIQSYSEHTRGDIKVLTELPRDKINNALIVDDLVDSGETLKFLLNTMHFPDARTVVLHRKATSLFSPDYYKGLIHKDTWINYPWEIEK